MSLDLNKLNPAQREAVECIEGASLIIAGAGSGKTRVLTGKIAHLIDCGISPFDILALTFTNKAAREMKERVISFSGSIANSIWIGTFHSMFARILRREAELFGFTKNFTIYDANDSLSVIKSIMSEQNVSTEKVNPKGVQALMSNAKNRFILPAEFESLAKTFFEKIVSNVYTVYFERLRRSNSMDFDDLLIYPLILFNQFEEILLKYQNKFKFILVDEYQDTNKAQYEIVKLLSKNHGNITVVGDDAQSIYKWRGAEIQNIFDFRNDFPDHKMFRLEQNYRSSKKILDFAGIVINKNTKQIEKNLWTENNTGEHVIMFESLTDKEESSKVAKTITKEIHSNKIKFKDIAILYRTNAQSRSFEEFFRLNGIPYIIVGGIRFYERKEIKDILAHLRIIINSNDDESLIRILLLKEGLGKTTVEKLKEISVTNKVTLFEVLKNFESIKNLSSKAKNRLIEVLNFTNKYLYLKEEMTLVELVRAVIDDTGILNKLRLENTVESDERVNNIQEFLSAVAQFTESTDTPKLEEFLTQVSLVSDIDEVDDRKNAVTLMTIHASKGLEFPVVFVVGIEEGIFPGTGALNSLEELEEERRLFYVAITRAMHRLYLSFANQRFRFGTRTYQVKSRFIKEVEDEINKKDLVKYEKKIPIKISFTSSRKNTAQKTKYDLEHFSQEEHNNSNYPDIVKGKFVFHDTFGKGVVLGTSGKGLEKKAEILFEDYGLKKLNLKFAKLRINIE